MDADKDAATHLDRGNLTRSHRFVGRVTANSDDLGVLWYAYRHAPPPITRAVFFVNHHSLGLLFFSCNTDIARIMALGLPQSRAIPAVHEAVQMSEEEAWTTRVSGSSEHLLSAIRDPASDFS